MSSPVFLATQNDLSSFMNDLQTGFYTQSTVFIRYCYLAFQDKPTMMTSPFGAFLKDLQQFEQYTFVFFDPHAILAPHERCIFPKNIRFQSITATLKQIRSSYAFDFLLTPDQGGWLRYKHSARALGVPLYAFVKHRQSKDSLHFTAPTSTLPKNKKILLIDDCWITGKTFHTFMEFLTTNDSFSSFSLYFSHVLIENEILQQSLKRYPFVSQCFIAAANEKDHPISLF